ncbi:hypothetical protein KJA16_01450 [Patescibacteria group bacterium]|nr:hypothetical protein [Patescibacteria group bacterium]
MKPYLFKKIIFSVFLFSFLTPCLAGAIRIPNPLEAETFEELIENLIDFIFWVAAAIVPLMIIIAAFYFITSVGNPDKVRTAKSIILWTVVGFTIVLLAKGIVSVIKQIIGG